MAKFFPLDLSKFKRVSSDSKTTTLRHQDGHEVKIAHNALSPKLRGNLAALPQHEEERGHESYNKSKPTQARFKSAESAVDNASKFAKGGEIRQSNPKLIESKKLPYYADGGEASADMTPSSMVKNPSHQPGDPSPEYMPSATLEDDKPLEAPYVDPVSLGVTAATGGASAVGPAVMNAVKNKATGAVAGAALKGFRQPAQVSGPATQIGQNTGYMKGQPKASYTSDLVKGVANRSTKPGYEEGGEVSNEASSIQNTGGGSKGSSGPNLASLAPLLLALANGGKVPEPSPSPSSEEEQNDQDVKDLSRKRLLADGGDVTPEDAPQAQDPNDIPPADEAPQDAQSPQVAPQMADMRRLYNQQVTVPTGKGQMAIPGKTFGPNGEAPQNFDPAAWNQAKGAYETEQSQRASQQQEAAQQGAMDAQARSEAGLPPATSGQAAGSAMPPAQGQPSQPTSAAPQAQQGAGDPFGTQATMNAFQQGLGEAKSGLAGEARALGAQGAEEAETLRQDVQKRQDAQQSYQDHFDALDAERQNFQQDLINQHIDPNHYLNSIGTVGKISTGIGLILGGMGGGLTHQENPALKFLQSQIDRDISAQQMELGKKENLLSANMRQFGNLKDATDMTRVMQNDIVSMQLKHAAAKAMDPLAKSRAMQAAGKIDMDSAQMQGQMAMRKTLLGGVNAGHVDPAKVVNLLLPQDQRAAGNKELQEAQTLVANRDAALSAFDKVARMNTIGNRMMNPIQSKQQIQAITAPIIAELSKATAGRFTEQDAGMLQNLFSKATSGGETMRVQRAALNNLLSKHIQSNNFPTLSTYGIDPANWGRFGNNGQSRIPESAPVTSKK